MDKKIYIQICIIFAIFFIIAYMYISYFKDPKISVVNNEKKNEKINIVKGSDDLITEMSYISEDNKGNRYEIKSEYGVINPNKSNFILMDKVTAIIYLLDGEKIFISSKKAQYNDNNNDTNFSGSVKMVYVDHIIKSENMDLSFKDQTATLYDKVFYKSSLSNLSADRISIDFINKNTKIQMNDENNNILVRSVINNGNN